MSIARRREVKAARRKKLLAERRRQAESGSSLASRVQRLAQAPVHRCLLSADLFEGGMGTLLLVRGTPASGLTMAHFLLDVFCLGVKDVTFSQIEQADLDEQIELIELAGPFAAVEVACARKLLRDLVAYARSIGFEPPREFKAAEMLFGDVSADACEVRFEFGHDGRPHYVPGPTETPAQIRHRLDVLRRSLGEDGFDFSDEEEDEDEDEDEQEGFAESEDLAYSDEDWLERYDPNQAPEPKEWLDTDEAERLDLVERYHRRARIKLDDPEVHAMIHVVVENQIAANDPAAVGHAVARLMAEGLDRHEAIHAVGAILAEFTHEVFKNDTPFANEQYVQAVEQLTAESWHRMFDEKDNRS